MKRILVVAGTSSDGGAGLEADQKTIAAHGCYATTAQAALTAQNTMGVRNIHHVPPEFVREQIDAVVEDIGVDVVKTGMLASAETISVVADALEKHRIEKTVIDPVMVATTGAVLLPENAVKTLVKELLPKTYLLTPNIPEANLILREAGKPPMNVHHIHGLKLVASAIQSFGPKYVLLKGGHLPLTKDYRVAKSDAEKAIVVNVLVGEDEWEIIEAPYQNSRNTHGTGDSLASAISCNIANGQGIFAAVRAACRYVDAGIRTSKDLGQGSGPLNHFHSLQIMPFAPGKFVEYILSRPDVKEAWQEFTHHEFVRQMGDGTLPRETFKYYMIQDYLYLIHFARAHALAGFKSKNLQDIADVSLVIRVSEILDEWLMSAAVVTTIRHEVNLHIAECKEFGISEEEMMGYPESQACTAYSRYCLDIGTSEDWLALQISLLPCLLGYGMIATRLKKEQEAHPPQNGNPYRTWIANYTDEGYQGAVTKGCALAEKHAVKQSPSRIEELVQIFIQAIRMETGFWEMASTP